MHTVLPQKLSDRLFLHHMVVVSSTPDLDGHSEIGPEVTQSLDHMFYASAVVAIYQLMQVRFRGVCILISMLTMRLCVVLG